MLCIITRGCSDGSQLKTKNEIHSAKMEARIGYKQIMYVARHTDGCKKMKPKFVQRSAWNIADGLEFPESYWTTNFIIERVYFESAKLLEYSGEHFLVIRKILG